MSSSSNNDPVQREVVRQAFLHDLAEAAKPASTFLRTHLVAGEGFPEDTPIEFLMVFGPRTQFTDPDEYGSPETFGMYTRAIDKAQTIACLRAIADRLESCSDELGILQRFEEN